MYLRTFYKYIMQRLSASGIAGLFENFPNMPRKKTKPGEFY